VAPLKRDTPLEGQSKANDHDDRFGHYTCRTQNIDENRMRWTFGRLFGKHERTQTGQETATTSTGEKTQRTRESVIIN